MHIRLSVLAAAALATVTVASAQRAQVDRDQNHRVTTTTRSEVNRAARSISQESGSGLAARPTMKPGRSLMAVAPGDSIMATDYDFQTNAAMGDRIINWPGAGGNNSIMSTLAYMARAVGSGNRGTYGAIYADFGGGLIWQPINLGATYTRIEPGNSGFNEVDHLSDNRLVNVSHNGTTINFAIETAPATGTFTVSTIPGSDAGFWPRVDVGGNNVIHVIWTTQDDVAPIVYARSTDMGVTWSTPIQLSGVDAGDLPNRQGESGPTASAFGADAYVISAAGNHVAIWYETGSVGLYQLRSEDNGATWMRSGYIALPNQQRSYVGDASTCDSCFYREPNRGDTISYRSDTAWAPGSSFDMLIGDDGTIYGTYPMIPTYVLREFFSSGDSSSIIYQADFSYTDVVGRSVWVNPDDSYKKQGLIPVPGTISNNVSFLDGRGYQGGFGRWFQLGMDASNNVYMVFGSGVESDTITGIDSSRKVLEPLNYMRSHLFATWTRDGENWSTPLNLTPNGIDAQYPSLANLVDNEMHIAYQADTFPGDYLTSNGTGGSRLHPNTPSVIRVYIAQTSMLPEPPVGGVRNEATASGSSLAAYPNPTAGSANVAYTIRAGGDLTLRVVNTLGATVATLVDGARTSAGSYVATFDASGLAAGRYYVVMTVNGNVTTSPLSIVR